MRKSNNKLRTRLNYLFNKFFSLKDSLFQKISKLNPTKNILLEKTGIIGSIATNLHCKTYLELGVLYGGTIDFIRPLVTRCIGVDIKDQRINKTGEFYKMTTDDFFKNFKNKADVIFIDADHKIESVIRDFENALKVLNKFGVIFLHDTDPKYKLYLKPEFCNNSYKIVDYIYKNHKELNALTLPISLDGLTIVSRKSDRRVSKFLSYL
jgi:hypothetical protein